ncbi:MAG: PTS galactosamine transporter subunit IIB [Bacilli bacterium]
MENINIILGRIDNRLVHGQVGVTWTNYIGANLIVVVDDEVEKDQTQQEIMELTAITSGADIRFFSVQKTINIIGNASPDQKIFIVTRTPYEMRKLIEGGVPLKKVNIGNMHFDEGKRQIALKVFVDDNDIENIRAIKDIGIDLFIQDIPGKPIEKLDI